MNKLVYLFELDSVRIYKNPHQSGILYTPGVKGLYTEIVKKGNSVALSMNQLTDSQLIREALTDDEAFSYLLQLFETGALRVSLYGKIRTASQYVQQSVQKCLDKLEEEEKRLKSHPEETPPKPEKDRFVFSNMPIHARDKGQLETVRDALSFSDLSFLQEKVKSASDEERTEMKMVYRFVAMILQLSVCETGNIPPKAGERRTFRQFLARILEEISVPNTFDEAFSRRVAGAIDVIKSRGEDLEERIRTCKDPDNRPDPDNRSEWRNQEENLSPEEKLANDVIDLSYNYTVEDSINGAAKHYDDETVPFRTDLLSRVEKYCSDVQEESFGVVSRGRWRAMVRLATYKAKKKKRYEPSGVYEANAAKEKRMWKCFLLCNTLTSFGMAFFYGMIFVAVNCGLSLLEGFSPLTWDNLLLVASGNVVLFGILGALIDLGLKALNGGKEIPDILDSIVDVIIHALDFGRAWGGKDDSYSVHR